MQKVIIVGAGIAGLTVAYELQKHGIEVIVLEAGTEVGGRARSFKWQDMWIDRGAQFFNHTDAGLSRIVGELGLDNRRQSIPRGLSFQVLRNNNWYDYSLTKPSSMFTSGLLSIGAKIRMVKIAAQVAKAKSRIGAKPDDLYEITRAAEFDNESMESWLSRINQEYLEYIAAPVWELFWSYRPDEISKALFLYSASKAQKPATYSFDEGVGLFTRSIARHLNVITEAKVTNVLAGATPVKVQWEKSGRLYSDVADGVVVAVHGNMVNSIVQGLEKEHVQFFKGVKYLPADMNYFTLRNKLEGYDKYHLYPRKEDPTIKGIYYGPCKTTQQKDYLIVCMKTDFMNRTRHMEDNAVLDLVEKEIKRYIPQAVSDITNRLIVRWQSGLPAYYAGYIQSLKQFQKLPTIPGLAFAGDYLNFPTTGGAYRSALNAANVVLSRHSDEQ